MNDEQKSPEQELAEMTEMAKRALADLQNFKRQVAEERPQLMGLGQLTILSEILPVMDNFSRAFKAEHTETEWTKGIEGIFNQLEGILKTAGLEKIASIGEKADPNLHETVSSAPGTQDEIIEELEAGYTFNGKVIRASKVIVGQG